MRKRREKEEETEQEEEEREEEGPRKGKPRHKKKKRKETSLDPITPPPKNEKTPEISVRYLAIKGTAIYSKARRLYKPSGDHVIPKAQQANMYF